MSRHSFLHRLFMALAVITIVFAFNSCNNDNENVQRFKHAAMSLDNTRHTLSNEFDYWPECGIRVTGSHLASLISLNDLQDMLPCPLYVSGPHHDGKWDLENDNDFGHYNPKAVQYLADLAAKVVADKKFVEMSKPLVDEYLYRQMRIMMVLHDAMYDQNMIGDEELGMIFDEVISSHGYGEGAGWVQASLDLEDGSYVYGNTSDRFFYFWARRWKDGTIDQFYQGLSTIYKAYYPDYQYTTEKYWIDEWYEGDEGWDFGGTTYDYELEPDEPIQKEERIDQSTAVDLIKAAVKNLDNSRNVLADEYDYWPYCGLRITGSHLFSLLSLRTLNRMLPCDLYLSGPHHYNSWDLNSLEDFGHYNPEAIKYLNQLASKVVSDKKFVDQTRPLIDKYLKTQMLTMMAIYDGLNDKNICKDKQAILDNSMELQGQTWYETTAGQFIGRLTGLDNGIEFSMPSEMMLYFWARRNADGTMELFHDGLKTVYMAYYPDYNYYQLIGQYYDLDDGDIDISYVVIDGSELRLRLSPSKDADTFKWPDGTNRHPEVGKRFDYLGESGDFYKINFNGNEVWVAKEFTHLE